MIPLRQYKSDMKRQYKEIENNDTNLYDDFKEWFNDMIEFLRIENRVKTIGFKTYIV